MNINAALFLHFLGSLFLLSLFVCGKELTVAEQGSAAMAIATTAHAC